jgi:hypothetical protein
MAFHFVVPVWGPKYTRVFLDAALPAQLAARNLGALRDPDRAVYRIFSTLEDLEVIRGASSFRRLEALLPVSLHRIELAGDRRYGLMSACHREAVRLADLEAAGLVFLNADLVLADGVLEALETWAAAGVRVVECASVRVEQAAAVRLLRERWLEPASGAIVSSPRQLVGLALDHLHPNAAAHLWDASARAALIPANLLWRIDGEGFLLHCFHLHPLMVVPERRGVSFHGTIDDDYVEAAAPDPATTRVVTDSDELFFCELSDESHPPGGTIAGGSTLALANWIRRATRPRHRRLAAIPIRLHRGERTLARWEPVEREAALLLGRSMRLAERLPFSVPTRLSPLLRGLERGIRWPERWSPGPG